LQTSISIESSGADDSATAACFLPPVLISRAGGSCSDCFGEVLLPHRQPWLHHWHDHPESLARLATALADHPAKISLLTCQSTFGGLHGLKLV
jgi:hypothetical protein